MNVNILGTDYTLEIKDFKDDSTFGARELNGYCDGVTKEIVICNMMTYPGYENKAEERNKIIEKETMRHEIVHAFLNESGLQQSSLAHDRGWATNEEMVDWIALQFPKMLKAFHEVECI